MYPFKSCKDIAKYLLEKTGRECEVNKTSSYLVVSYVYNGELKTRKIPAGVIYCIQDTDMEPLIKEMKDN